MNKLVNKSVWDNYIEGTRQNDSVTLGERVTFLGQPIKVVT